MNLGQTTPDLILNHNPDPELVKLASVGDKSPKLAHETYIDQKSEVYANESSVGSWLQTEVTRVLGPTMFFPSTFNNFLYIPLNLLLHI